MTAVQIRNILPIEPSMIDDLMEFTSDIDRGLEHGEDIDIDIDLTIEDQGAEEDEYMVEDSITAVPENEDDRGQSMHVTNDDVMVDDAYAEVSIADKSSVQDEDLEDAEYLEPDEGENGAIPVASRPSSQSRSELLEYEDQIESNKSETYGYHAETINTSDQQYPVSIEQDDSYESRTAVTLEGSQSEDEKLDDSSQDENSGAIQSAGHQRHEGNDNLLPESSTMSLHGEQKRERQEVLSLTSEDQLGEAEQFDSSVIEEATKVVPTPPVHTENENPDEEIDDLSPAIESRSEDSITSAVHEDHNIEGSDYVHPIVVLYQNSEISLFPPVDQAEEHTSTYFLQDEQLANESFTKLLEACRSVLGESISAQEELILDIGALDLHISEFAPESSTTTLADIVHIYIHLQHYDGQSEPPALYMRLTTIPRFSLRLEYLMNAIADEKGLSQTRSSNGVDDLLKLGAEQAPSPLDPQSAKNLSSHKVGTPQHRQSTNDEESILPIVLQIPPKALSNSSGNIDAATKASGAESDAISEGQATNHAITVSNALPLDNVTNGEDNHSSNTLHSRETGVISLATQLNGAEPDAQDVFSIDNDDFIDYEDDNEQANETSSGSSTLLGDILGQSDDMFDSKEKDISSLLPPKEHHEGSIHSYSERLGNYEALEKVVERKVDGALPVLFDDETKDAAVSQHVDEAKPQPANASEDQGASDTNEGDLLKTELFDGHEEEEQELLEPNQAENGEHRSPSHERQTDLGDNSGNLVLNPVKSTIIDGYSESSVQENQNGQREPYSFPESIGQGRKEDRRSEAEAEAKDEDEDEITYDDDEYAVEAPYNLPSAIDKVNSSLESLKRTRTLCDEESHEIEIKDSKRLRSG